MITRSADGAPMSVARNIGYGIGGFALSLTMVILTAACLQYLVFTIWSPPEGLLIAFGSAFATCILAMALPWACLLKGLRNKAMVRGVWCQIYVFVVAAVGTLLVVLFW